MATQHPTHQHPAHGNGHRNSREIEHDIERTRSEMDHTLDELSARLNPRHLLDEVFDYFRGSTSMSKGDVAHQAKVVGKTAVRQIKRHPVPAALIGAGLLWMLFEEDEDERDFHSQWADIPEYGGSFVDARTGEPYDVENYGAEWKQEAAAWRSDYDWSKSEVDEQTWTEQAKKSLNEIRSTLSDSSRSAYDKMKHASAHVAGLSGHKRRDIHARWANLREHSGSFVDARTGEPYDENYGREWQALVACDYCATGEMSEEEKQSWSEKAQHALEDMQETLADTSRSAKEQVQALASKIGEYVGATRDMSAEYSHSIARSLGSGASRAGAGARHAGQRVGQGARYVGRQARSGGASVGRQMSHGYAYSRDAVSEAMDEYPLAAGAACLGLGLLLGLALPHTRYEDRWMGETSDELKHRAKETGREAADRAKHVAEATASAAMEEAERQGLTPRQVAEKVQHAAAEVGHTLEEEARGASPQKLAEKAQHVAERAAETAKEETKKESKDLTS